MIFLLYKNEHDLYNFDRFSHTLATKPSSNNGFAFFVLDRTSGQGLQKNNDPSCINKFKDKRF